MAPLIQDEAARLLEVTLSYKHDIDCAFCAHSQAMKAFSPLPMPSNILRALLLLKKRQGFSHVSFIGGDPSLDPYLGDVLRFAKNLGYRTRVVSNGAGFAKKGVAGNILPFLDELCLTVHGGLVKDSGCDDESCWNFGRLMRSLANIASFPTLITIGIVASKRNIDSLRRLVSLIKESVRVKEFWLSGVAPVGRALDCYDTLVLKHETIAMALPLIVAAGTPVPFKFHGLPFCLLDDHRRQAVIWEAQPAVNVFLSADYCGKPALREMGSSLADIPRVATGKCECCAYMNPCGGLEKAYYEKFGDSELNPITCSRLDLLP